MHSRRSEASSFIELTVPRTLPLPQDSEAAFANIVLANGVASAIAYFTFPELAKGGRRGSTIMAGAALLSACIAIVAYLAAEAVQRRQCTFCQLPPLW